MIESVKGGWSKEDIKARWVAALRSGEYKQRKKQLRDKQSFCCLGVLCDLYIKAGCGGVWEGDRFNDGGDSSASHPPRAVQRWAAIGDGEPPAYHEDMTKAPLMYQIGGLNDTGLTFAEIADWIEAHV